MEAKEVIPEMIEGTPLETQYLRRRVAGQYCAATMSVHRCNLNNRLLLWLLLSVVLLADLQDIVAVLQMALGEDPLDPNFAGGWACQGWVAICLKDNTTFVW